MTRRLALLACSTLLAIGCRPRFLERPAQAAPERSAAHDARGQTPAAASAKRVDQNAHPPPAAPLGDASPAKVATRTLPGGLDLGVITRRRLPLVSVRLLIRAGQASDGARPGAAALTSRLLAASGAGRWSRGKLAARIESLGGRLHAHVGRDATWLGLDVTRDHLDSALDLIAAIATQPRFLPATFQRVRQRAQDAVRARAAGDPDRAIEQTLSRRLFELPVGVSPYAHGAASPAELGALSLEDCRRWYRKHFVPGNAVLVVAGDVDPDSAAHSATAAFARWKGHAPAGLAPTRALAPDRVEVDVIDRPGSHHSRIAIGTPGPERDGPRWAALLGAVELLGGPSGRLQRLVDRHLAQRIGARVEPMAHGPALITISAHTTTEHTAEAVERILGAMAKLAGGLPGDAETEAAMRALVERYARRAATVQGLSHMAMRIATLGLHSDAAARLDSALRDLDPRSVNAAAQLFLRRRHVRIVVSGDAKRVSRALTHFGPVHLVDPGRGFTVIRSLPADPSAKLAITAGKAK